MSKEEKAPEEKPKSKLKFKTPEDAAEALESAKGEREVARTEFKDFRKENEIKKEVPPTEEKLLKKYTKLLDTKTKKETAVEDIQAWIKENKPKKEKKPRDTKYDYPADCKTSGDKKKFRAAQRAAAKKAAKGEKPEKKKDKDKKSDGKKDKDAKGKGDKKGGEKKSEKAPEKKKEKKDKETPAED